MKFTIVTIVRNGEKFIMQTIKSVLEQDYENLEYLIIDGNSSDSTVKIVTELAKESGRDVMIYSEPDFGIYNAMNRGIARASGEYIIFMNAGDSFWSSGVLTAMEKRIRRNGKAIYYGKACLMKNGRRIGFKDAAALGQTVFDMLMKGRMPAHQSIVAPTDTLRANYFNEQYKIRADYDWLIRSYKDGVKFVNLDMVVCNYDYSGFSSKAIEDHTLQAETSLISKKNYPVAGRIYELLEKCQAFVRKG